MNNVAIIVDPLSTGQAYPMAFRDAGVSPVAVLSTDEPVDVLKESWHPENFDHVHYFDGDIPALAEVLRAYDPVCIIPGSETGVPLYEALVVLLLPGTGNVPELANARRDKWAMANAVAAAGIPRLRQLASADAGEIRQWLVDNDMTDTDLVIKPRNSAGTDDVHLVRAGGDWLPLLERMVPEVNHLGVVNGPIIVQEYAEGVEYLIDSYSVDGKHGLVDVCRYTKVQRDDRIGIYDRVDFLAPDDPNVVAIWPYVLDVLDALGIRNGCGHAEVMLTANGPRLIEVAERPAGGGHQMISEMATGDNHILRTVAHRVRGEFKPGYELQQYVRGMFISSLRDGIWRNAEVFDGIDDLPTFVGKNFVNGTGDFVHATDDLSTFLGWVILAGPDEQAIDADYREIKRREAQIVIEPVSNLMESGV